MTIPKLLHTTWIGPKPPPMKWINTWRDKHPDWEHILWDNNKVFGRHWRNQKHIDFYRQRQIWHGVADLVRYEVLFEMGGFNPGADSLCFHNIEELLQDPAYDAYSVYENEKVRPGLVSPLHGATQGNQFAKILIDTLNRRPKVGKPWKTTGNGLMKELIAKTNYPRLKIWPSHYFIPVHYTGESYHGTDKVYAQHIFVSDRVDEDARYQSGVIQ